MAESRLLNERYGLRALCDSSTPSPVVCVMGGIMTFRRRLMVLPHAYRGRVGGNVGSNSGAVHLGTSQNDRLKHDNLRSRLRRQLISRPGLMVGLICIVWLGSAGANPVKAMMATSYGVTSDNPTASGGATQGTSKQQQFAPISDEKIRQSLQGSRLPWYDAENDRIKSVPLQEGAPSASRDRATIPEATVTPQATPVTPVGTASMVRNGWLSDALVYTLVAVGIVIGLYVLAQTVIGKKDMDQDDDEFDIQPLTDSERVRALPYAVSGNPANFRSLAEQFAQKEDYKTAIIYMFSHLLLQLDQSRWIALRAGRTNRQYLWDLPWESPLRDYFERSMIVFEEAFFGDKQVSGETFVPLWGQLPTMEAFIKQRAVEMNDV